MFRSIRWTLQIWHAAILTASLLCFGAVLYHHERHATLDRVDAELEGAARVLAHGPIGPPPRWFNATTEPAAPEDGRPWPDDRRQLYGGAPVGHPLDADPSRFAPSVSPTTRAASPHEKPIWYTASPPADFSSAFAMSDHGTPATQPGRGQHFAGGRMLMRDWWSHVPQDVLRRLGQDPRNQPYFAVWESDGSLVRSSTTPTQLIATAPPARLRSSSLEDEDAPSTFRQIGTRREAIVSGSHGITVVVGTSIQSEQDALARLRWSIILSGLGVLSVGLAGGWFFSQRALRPIAQISHIADSISASDLSQRIATDDTHSELGSLATTLNGTFERLQNAFERQVRFTADASHELRTPLSVIQSHGELALSRERTPDEYRQTIQTCLRATRRMRSLVDSLLAIARSDAGRVDLRPERFNLREAAEECLLMMTPQAQEHRVKVESQLAELQIEADRMRVSQLLINLLSNAIRYNREGGIARLTTQGMGTDSVIVVADTGVGIADEDQAHVFERFFRSDKARSREAGGSGLGLAICQGIVDAHGGSIDFTSESGKGSVFTVRLPLEMTTAGNSIGDHA